MGVREARPPTPATTGVGHSRRPQAGLQRRTGRRLESERMGQHSSHRGKHGLALWNMDAAWRAEKRERLQRAGGELV